MHQYSIRKATFAAALATAFIPVGAMSQAIAGELTVFANGEELATEGFLAPERTRDGWELKFDHVFFTLSDITAMQTDPPYDAEVGGAPEASVTIGIDTHGPLTIDLANVDSDGRVRIGSSDAPEGHYSAVAWSVVPAPSGAWEGQSMVLIGTAMKEGRSVSFTLTSTNRHDYVCGEYVGDMRKGFLKDGGVADLELTFHLDHVFGREDKAATNPMNTGALGFDAFASGGVQAIDLSGLHIGHVGEGHCAVTYR